MIHGTLLSSYYSGPGAKEDGVGSGGGTMTPSLRNRKKEELLNEFSSDPE